MKKALQGTLFVLMAVGIVCLFLKDLSEEKRVFYEGVCLFCLGSAFPLAGLVVMGEWRGWFKKKKDERGI